MGAKASTQSQRPRALSSPSSPGGGPPSSVPGTSHVNGASFTMSLLQGHRSNSASDPGIDLDPRGGRRFDNISNGQPVSIPARGAASMDIASRHTSAVQLAARSAYFDSDSSPEESLVLGSFLQSARGGSSSQSLPVHLGAVNGLKCPVCSKFIPPDDIECHLVMCLTKPRISYNEDVLDVDSGECIICLEEMSKGHAIARLQCLCVYHKYCIDKWFEVNRSCPEHPTD